MEIEIYLKEKNKRTVPQEHHNPKWKIEVNSIDNARRFLNKMALMLPQEKHWIICVDMNFKSGRRTTAYCYNIREYFYFTMGFEKLYTLLEDSIGLINTRQLEI